MGFYIKKSIRVGPMRFNLSNSGVGVSIGIKGLRIGTGPRGNYIYMGAGGISYRASLSPNAPPARRKNIPQARDDYTVERNQTHAPLEEIESSHITQIIDSSSRELLDELNSKRKKLRVWPLVAIISLGIVFYGYSEKWQQWSLGFALIGGLIFTILAYNYDQLRKTTVLFYDFDKDMESSFQRLHESASKLASCAKIWHIEASGSVYDPKYHAGANNLVRRKATSICKTTPPFLKTNIETIAITVGRQILHFFPDRVLIYDRDGVGAVSYNQLFINVGDSQFIESDSVPRDAMIVGRTWRYVNKSGGPDRRFKDNNEIPICLYQNISFTSHSGLNELLQLSKIGYGEDFSLSIDALSKKIKVSN